MRAALALLAVLASLLLAGLFADTATADAPNLDLHSSGKSAVAIYRPTPTSTLTVVGADLVSQTGEPRRYLAGIGIQEDACPDCLRVPLRLLEASAEFDSPQLHGSVTGARLDVTLPVTYCVLSTCPTSIRVCLVWEPSGQPIRDTNSTRTETQDCKFTRVTRFAYADATPTGLVSDGTTNLASGQGTGNVLEQSTRIVGFGDPHVCL